MRSFFSGAVMLIGLGALAGGCEAFTGTSSSDPLGPSTSCGFSLANSVNPGKKAIGQSCASGADCETNVCVLATDAASVTNKQFGFCSRGCDCANDKASILTAEQKAKFTCIYPPSPNQTKRHMVLQCSSPEACQQVDAGWTGCTNQISGTSFKVCTAL